MADINIDLGESSDLCCSAPISPEKPRKYYPSFTYSGKGDSEYEFPSEGTMTIQFRKVNETESTNEEGESRHSCTFEIQKIVSVEGSGGEYSEEDNPTRPGKVTEDALDAIAKALKKGKY